MTFVLPSVDFAEFHKNLAASVTLDTDRFDHLPPISFLLPGDRSVTYRVVDGSVVWSLRTGESTDGDTADATVIVIDEFSFGAFVGEFLTAPALQIQQRIRFESGSYGDFDVWEPLLRRLYTGRPLYDPTAVDRSDLDRVFVWGTDGLAEIGEFYNKYGFAIVRGVFSPSEATAIDQEIDVLALGANSENGESWWVTSESGEERVCQLHYTSLVSSTIAELEGDERIKQLVACVNPELVAHPEIGNGHFAVLKNPGVTGGLTDLAWHVDCGLGGHSLLCPSLHIGVQLREMTAESGPMMFLAGSHKTSSVRPTREQEESWPVVTVSAQPGDVTLHSPDAVHAAPPPTGSASGRRTLYLSFGPPELSEVFGFKEGYDHLVFDNDGHAEFTS